MSDDTSTSTHEASGPMPTPTPFLMLCGSMAAQVQMALGLLPDPVEGKVQVELGAAQQGIDLLAMLEEKTQGNLDENEAKTLSYLLSQLRLLYVQRAKDGAAEPEAGASTELPADGSPDEAAETTP